MEPMNTIHNTYEARLRQISNADWDNQFVTDDGIVKEIAGGCFGQVMHRISILLDLQDKFLGRSSEALKYMIVSVAHSPSFLSTEQKLVLALSAAESFNRLVAKVEQSEGLEPYTLYNVRIIDADIYENFLDRENVIDLNNQTVTVATDEVDNEAQIPVVKGIVQEVDDSNPKALESRMGRENNEPSSHDIPGQSPIIVELDDTNAHVEHDREKQADSSLSDHEKQRDTSINDTDTPNGHEKDAVSEPKETQTNSSEKTFFTSSHNIDGDEIDVSIAFSSQVFSQRQDNLLMLILENHKISRESTQNALRFEEILEQSKNVAPVQTVDKSQEQNSNNSSAKSDAISVQKKDMPKGVTKEHGKELAILPQKQNTDTTPGLQDFVRELAGLVQSQSAPYQTELQIPRFIISQGVALQLLSLFAAPFMIYRESQQNPSQLVIRDSNDAVLPIANAQSTSEQNNSGSGSGSQSQDGKSQDNNSSDQGQNPQNRFSAQNADDGDESSKKAQQVQSRVTRQTQHVDFNGNDDEPEISKNDELEEIESGDQPFERPTLYPEVFKVLRTLKGGKMPFNSLDSIDDEVPRHVQPSHANKDLEAIEKESQEVRKKKIKVPHWLDDSLDEYRSSSQLATVLQSFSTMANKLNKNVGMHLACQDRDNGQDFFYFIYGLGRIEGANKLRNTSRELIKINYSGRKININLDNVKDGYTKLPLREKLWLYQLARLDNAPLSAESKDGVIEFLKNGLDAALASANADEKEAVMTYMDANLS